MNDNLIAWSKRLSRSIPYSHYSIIKRLKKKREMSNHFIVKKAKPGDQNIIRYFIFLQGTHSNWWAYPSKSGVAMEPTKPSLNTSLATLSHSCEIEKVCQIYTTFSSSRQFSAHIWKKFSSESDSFFKKKLGAKLFEV